jgi:hypothetical protein
MAEPAHRRGAATRAQVPALLKGLIFGPNGRPMSPSHTRRRGRIYRYYVTREAIADGYDSCALASVPAADVDGAVLDHVQKLLAAPELVARTWATAKREDTRPTRATPARLPLSRGPAARCGAAAFSVWLWRAASFRLGPGPPQLGSMEQPRASFGSCVLGSCAKWVHGGGVGLPFWQPRLSIGRPGCAHAARRRP